MTEALRWPKDAPRLLVGRYGFNDGTAVRFAHAYAHLFGLIVSVDHEWRGWLFRVSVGRLRVKLTIGRPQKETS